MKSLYYSFDSITVIKPRVKRLAASLTFALLREYSECGWVILRGIFPLALPKSFPVQIFGYPVLPNSAHAYLPSNIIARYF